MNPSPHLSPLRRGTETKELPRRTHASQRKLPHESPAKSREQLEELLDQCKKTIAKQCKQLREEDFFHGELPYTPPLCFQGIPPLTPTLGMGASSDQTICFLEKLTAEMLVMTIDAKEETTLLLPKETGSPFAGTKIILQSFSTAPKVFNVTIHTSEEAAMLIEARKAIFLELLQDRKFLFGINRMETLPLTEEESYTEHKEHEESYP